MQTLQTRQASAQSASALTAGWTKPFHGVQHLGADNRWATVTDRGSSADLTCWFPGCGFRLEVSTHTDAEKARRAGETWFGLFGHA